MTNADGPVVDSCPNCGAPLKLDTAGDCVWCHAHVRVTASPVAPSTPMDAERAMRVLFGNPLEGEPGDIELLQPACNLLVFLSTTGQDAAVQDFLSHWEHKDAVGPLLHAVRAAGTRVTLVAKAAPGFDEFTDHSALYTPDEWWTIALAADLLALLAGLPGVDPMQAADSKNEAQDDRKSYGRHFAKGTPPSGDDSAALLAMREALPGAGPQPAPAGDSAADSVGEPEQAQRGGRHHLFGRHRNG